MSKQPPHYLVDGYNLIHAWEEIRGEELEKVAQYTTENAERLYNIKGG